MSSPGPNSVTLKYKQISTYLTNGLSILELASDLSPSFKDCGYFRLFHDDDKSCFYLESTHALKPGSVTRAGLEVWEKGVRTKLLLEMRPPSDTPQ